MRPKISIIVPCYNVEQYLDRCMRSLFNQTLQNIEFILVDDGSPDKCPQLCDEYTKTDKRIKVIHKKNAGLGFARNSGLEVATGEYIAFVDSDDFVDLSMYATLYDMAEGEKCDAVFCGIKKEKRNRQGWYESSEVNEDLIMEGEEIESFMLGMIASPLEEYKERKYSMSVWHAIYRREIITNFNIKFHSERDVASEDLPFNISFLRKAKRIGYINKCLYYYCYNDTSLTSTFKKEKFPAFVKLYNLISNELTNVPQAQIRCDRFVIGYTRGHLIEMMDSNTKDRLKYIKDICNHDVWLSLSNRLDDYNPKNRFQRIFYKLLISKSYRRLYLFCLASAKIKRLIKK